MFISIIKTVFIISIILAMIVEYIAGIACAIEWVQDEIVPHIRELEKRNDARLMKHAARHGYSYARRYPRRVTRDIKREYKQARRDMRYACFVVKVEKYLW